MRAAVAPILGVFWPNSPTVMRPAHDALEELRRVAMHRWSLVRDARLITGSSLQARNPSACGRVGEPATLP